MSYLNFLGDLWLARIRCLRSPVIQASKCIIDCGRPWSCKWILNGAELRTLRLLILLVCIAEHAHDVQWIFGIRIDFSSYCISLSTMWPVRSCGCVYSPTHFARVQSWVLWRPCQKLITYNLHHGWKKFQICEWCTEGSDGFRQDVILIICLPLVILTFSSWMYAVNWDSCLSLPIGLQLCNCNSRL